MQMNDGKGFHKKKQNQMKSYDCGMKFLSK